MPDTKYAVGDEVTVEYDDEGETDTLTGIITGFHDVTDDETGQIEKGFWLKYVMDTRDGPHTLIAWWRLTAICAPIGSSGAAEQ